MEDEWQNTIENADFATNNDVASYFDERAYTWAQEHSGDGALHAKVAQLAGVQKDSRVLDIGCGAGVMVPAYLHAGAQKVVGIDVSEKMVEVANLLFARDRRLEFRCADITASLEESGLEEGSFDVVVIFNAYPHIANIDACVKNVRRLLVPGGRFLVAHGAGYQTINECHANLPEGISRDLLPAQEEARAWENAFTVKNICDEENFYCFGGCTKD